MICVLLFPWLRIFSENYWYFTYYSSSYYIVKSAKNFHEQFLKIRPTKYFNFNWNAFWTSQRCHFRKNTCCNLILYLRALYDRCGNEIMKIVTQFIVCRFFFIKCNGFSSTSYQVSLCSCPWLQLYIELKPIW